MRKLTAISDRQSKLPAGSVGRDEFGPNSAEAEIEGIGAATTGSGSRRVDDHQGRRAPARRRRHRRRPAAGITTRERERDRRQSVVDKVIDGADVNLRGGAG
jgi:hypothetical protein